MKDSETILADLADDLREKKNQLLDKRINNFAFIASVHNSRQAKQKLRELNEDVLELDGIYRLLNEFEKLPEATEKAKNQSQKCIELYDIIRYQNVAS